ncbi:MAG: hypothetical protein JWM68_3643 [Verrucomicrobiales bacterium]|nr:hypothetical protein [Verrucomicrobiales bacterium]
MKSAKILSFGLKLILGLGFLPFAFAQGGLTPSGAPGPTMKTLDQIYLRTDARSAITNSGAVIISQSGSYYLTTNITVSSGDAITINTNEVTLDLNGFTIFSTAAPAGGSAILINGVRSDIAIHGGFIHGSVTNNGSGSYSGNGFGYGITFSGTLSGARVANVSVSGCQFYGIFLGFNVTTVESCTVKTVGGLGIYADIVSASVAVDCGGTALSANSASNCRGQSSAGTGVYAAITAQNSYGQSSQSDGLSAFTANNCYGISSNGVGLNATVANNCLGTSTSGRGISGRTANNSYGSSVSGRGVFVEVANNCEGSCAGGNDVGLYAIFIAIGSYGYSSTNTGLFTTIGNSSFGQNNSGISETVGNKYNMP